MQIVITAPWNLDEFPELCYSCSNIFPPSPTQEIRKKQGRMVGWGLYPTPSTPPPPPPTPPPPPPSLVLLCPEEGGGCLLRTIRDFPGGSQDLRAVCCLPLAMFSHYLHDLGDVGQVPPYFFLVIYLFVWLHWVILVLTGFL